MDILFVDMILAIAEEALVSISNDESLKKAILVECISIDDWIQLKFGAVNKRCLREAIELAINTSVVRDKDTICKIIALITSIYATNQIKRGAEVGGTLLKVFGNSVFPHINESELRFAKNIDEKVYLATIKLVNESFESHIRSYNFNMDVFVKSVSPANNWTATSMVGVHGIGYIIMTYGAKFISQMRLLLRIFN